MAPTPPLTGLDGDAAVGQEGGYKWAKRLQDQVRARLQREMTTPTDAET